MKNKLIAITGEYLALRKLVEHLVQTEHGFMHFPSLEDMFRDGDEKGFSQFAQQSYAYLAQKEIERDEIVLNEMAKGMYPIIDQWHIVNLARARVRSSTASKSYEDRLVSHLKLFSNTQIHVIHASTDLEKFFSNEKLEAKKQEYLHVSQICTDWNAKIHTIDVDALNENIKKRFLFLIKEIQRSV